MKVSTDYIQVFECECGSRTLRHMQMVPAFRTLVSIDHNYDCEFDGATVADSEVDSLMKDNWTDQPDDETSHFFCPYCGKRWPSLLIGPDSCRGDGRLRYIHKNQLDVWFETEFDKNKYSWEIREHRKQLGHLFVFKKNDEIIGVKEVHSWQPEIAGELWYALTHDYLNPEHYIRDNSDVETDPDYCAEALEEYNNESSIVVRAMGELNEQNASVWTEDIYWEYTKETARKFYADYEVDVIPHWAVCYLVNGDDDTTDEWSEAEKKAVEDYDSTYVVMSTSPSTKTDLCPWTDKLTDVYECIVIKRNKSDENEN